MPRRNPNSPRIVLTTAPNSTSAAQIVYGLELRGIGAAATEAPPKSHDQFAIILTDGDEFVARSAIAVIWDAMLESMPRAMDHNSNCLFCGYNTQGLAPPVICPECGNNLDSLESRRAASEGRIPR